MHDRSRSKSSIVMRRFFRGGVSHEDEAGIHNISDIVLPKCPSKYLALLLRL